MWYTINKMRKKICVYTCITGGYDNLHEIENPEKDVDYYCFTNNKNLKSKTWKVVQIDDAGLDNCRLARKVKILGHPSIDEKYDIYVWSDADVVWQKKISDFVKTFLKDAPFAIFKHHSRKSIREEAIACLTCRKDSKEIIKKTLDFYETTGYKDDNGLFESTVFISRRGDADVCETMQTWFEMVKKYSRRDQLSFSYAIWKHNLKVDAIELNVWNNDWFVTEKHAGRGSIKDCHLYYGDINNEEFDFERYHIANYDRDGDCYLVKDAVPADTSRIEINPTNLVGACYSEVKFVPAKARVELVGLFEYKNKRVFCGGCNTVIISGDFKKGQKIEFMIKMRELEGVEIADFMEQAWVKEMRATQKIDALNIRVEQLELSAQRLDEIQNGKLWKTARTAKRLVKKLVRKA